MTSDTPAPEEKNSALTREIKYATFNVRMFASVIDIFLVMFIALPVSAKVTSMLYPPLDMGPVSSFVAVPHARDEALHGLVQMMLEQHVVARFLVTNIIQIVLIALYILPQWFKYRNTLGKIIMGIEIRDADSYAPITNKQAIIRFLGYILSGIPLTLGFLWTLFNRRRRCWHDFMANTIVVFKEKKTSSAPQSANP